MIGRIKKKYLEELNTICELQKEAICRGAPETYSEYKGLCGYLEGVERSKRVFEGILDELVKTDERLEDELEW